MCPRPIKVRQVRRMVLFFQLHDTLMSQLTKCATCDFLQFQCPNGYSNVANNFSVTTCASVFHFQQTTSIEELLNIELTGCSLKAVIRDDHEDIFGGQCIKGQAQ